MTLFKKAVHFGSGVILAQLITAASIPFLSRLYTPEDFSTFGLYFSISSILTVLVTLRLETLLPSEENIEEYLPTITSIAWITIIPLIIISFLTLAFINHTFNFTDIIFSVLIVVAAITFSFFNTINILNVRMNQIRLTNKARLVRSGVSAGLQIILSGLIKNGLFVGEIIGRFIGLIILSKKSYYEVRIKKSLILIREKIHYIKFVLISNLIGTFGLNFYPILVLKYYDPLLVGKYFFVHKILSAPVTIVAQSISISFLGDFNTIIKKEKKKLILSIHRMTIILFISTLIFFFGLGVFLKYTEIFLFGEKWYGSYIYVFTLIPLLVAQISFSPYSQILILVKGEKKQLLWDMSRLIAVILSVLIPLITDYKDKFLFSVFLYSFSSAILYVIHYFILINAIRNFKNV